MRLPFLQLASEAFERAVELAALLDINEAQALGHLCHLWRWCLSRPQDEALDGLVDGAKAGALIEAGSRWDGQGGAFVEALVEVGLVELDTAAAFRVRGLDRYREALVRQTSDRERKRRTRMSAGRPQDGVRNPASDADADADAEKPNVRAVDERVRPATLQAIEAPTTPPEGWTGHDFWCWYQAERRKGGEVQEKAPHPGKVSAWWSIARGTATVARLQAAAYRYGEDAYWLKQNPPIPFRGFMAQWDRFLRSEVTHAVG